MAYPLSRVSRIACVSAATIREPRFLNPSSRIGSNPSRKCHELLLGIAFLGDRRYLYSAAERLGGYHDALTAARLSTEWVATDLVSPDAAEAATRHYMSAPEGERPTALFAAQNYLTEGAVRALHALSRTSRLP